MRRCLISRADNFPSVYFYANDTLQSPESYQIISEIFTSNMFVMAVSLMKIFVTLCLFIVLKILPPVLNNVKPPFQREKPYAFKHASEKSRLNKKPHCVQAHNPCRGSRLRVKIRKWRVALLQVVTRGLSVSSSGSRSSLTLESTSGKATLDIMKHSVTGPLSSLLARPLPWRIF